MSQAESTGTAQLWEVSTTLPAPLSSGSQCSGYDIVKDHLGPATVCRTQLVKKMQGFLSKKQKRQNYLETRSCYVGETHLELRV